MVLDYFATKILLGEHDVLITAELIQKWHSDLGSPEMFETSLNTFCKNSTFSSTIDQINWIRCVSVLRSYFPKIVNNQSFVDHCRSLRPPVYMVKSAD